ncbi:hypothetical protein B0H16DRAFT_1693549 [Mycena metata]|uniref:Uncharacterized protein n=1 Tax=Mycena metata TaxID=1033252 RepID=A0AAD7IH68_9AGAR|nr:hypothetical protein B0H16DRAFT_1693549 [Mycena metata]
MTSFNNSRFVLPPPKSRRTNPLRDPNYNIAHTEEASDGTDSSRASLVKREDGLLRKLIRTDQYSFLSGSSKAALQACHVLTAIQSTNSKEITKAQVEAFKASIEEYATELWFNRGEPFVLDGRANLILLTAVEHVELDLYGLFAFYPGYFRLHLLLSALKVTNAEWADRAASDSRARRDLPTDESSVFTAAVEWEVLVFHVEDFSPNGQPISILNPNKRQVRQNDGIPAPRLPSDWQDCTVRDDPLNFPVLLKPDGSPLVLRFDQGLRQPKEKLSLFAMIVNLHSKLAAFESSSTMALTPALNLLIHRTSELMDEIFYKPPGLALTLPVVPTPSPETTMEILTQPLSQHSTSDAHMSDDITLTATSSTHSDSTTDAQSPPAESAPDPDSIVYTHATPLRYACGSENIPSDANTEILAHAAPAPEPLFANDLTLSECNTLLESLQTTERSSLIFRQLLFGANGVPNFEMPETRRLREEGWGETDSDDEEDDETSNEG